MTDSEFEAETSPIARSLPPLHPTRSSLPPSGGCFLSSLLLFFCYISFLRLQPAPPDQFSARPCFPLLDESFMSLAMWVFCVEDWNINMAAAPRAPLRRSGTKAFRRRGEIGASSCSDRRFLPRISPALFLSPRTYQKKRNERLGGASCTS